MMSLFDQKHSFALLISPPASGKTSYLLQLFRDYPDYDWVFVSPLRALADEFKNRVRNLLGESILESKIIIDTAEKLMASKYQKYFDQCKTVFVFDEFHLFYLWGESFRFSLLHIWYKVATSKAHVIGMSATVLTTELAILKDHVLLNFSQGYIIDCGNLEFKNPPHKTLYIPVKKRDDWLLFKEWELYKRAWRFRNKKRALMIFVAYRGVVDSLVDQCQKLGLRALGCKGGEVQAFREALAHYNFDVDIIISTSCLSHGVNLPSFDKVMIDHEVSESFWIQMAARGGRKGEKFQLVCAQEKYLNPTEKIKYLFTKFFCKIHLCFMKEFWFINRLIKNVIL